MPTENFNPRNNHSLCLFIHILVDYFPPPIPHGLIYSGDISVVISSCDYKVKIALP